MKYSLFYIFCTLGSFSNETDCHYMSEILLKLTLNWPKHFLPIYSCIKCTKFPSSESVTCIYKLSQHQPLSGTSKYKWSDYM